MRSPSPLLLLFAGAFAGTLLLVRAMQASPVHAKPPPPPAEWLPPDWLQGADALALPALDSPAEQEGPRGTARSALVFDLDEERVLMARGADLQRPVASLTKVVTALAWASLQPYTEAQSCVGAEERPTRSGARSRLHTGDCAPAMDMLGAALVASDNRAAYALGNAAGTDVDGLVSQMNEVSAALAMDQSEWADPSGLEDENLSTARDISRALLALSSHPTLAMAASAPAWLLSPQGRAPRLLHTTNRLSERSDLSVQAAKTGYTDTAGYCFSGLFEQEDGRRLLVTVLGATSDKARWAEVDRLLRWARG